MSKSSCKCEQEECECPEWIFTFADLVMLMMGFFVLMWVLKPSGNPKAGDGNAAAAAQQEEWLVTVGEIRSGFGWSPNPSSSDPVDQAMLRRRRNPAGPGQGGKTLTPRDGAEGTDPEVTTIRAGQQATVGGRLLFNVGDAAILPATRQTLDQIADQIRGHRTIVMVKGHTSADDFPEGTSAERKMALSLRRAQAVADYLTGRGVEPDILRVQGCSTFEPVVQHAYTSNVQGQNRRVEVESTNTLVSQRQSASKPAH